MEPLIITGKETAELEDIREIWVFASEPFCVFVCRLRNYD